MTVKPWPEDKDLDGAPFNERYVLRLYVAGTTPRSASAVANVRKVCDEYLAGQYDLEVIDVLRYPEAAAKGQVLAAPMLVKHLPLPIRRFIGDMSKTDRLLAGLGIRMA